MSQVQWRLVVLDSRTADMMTEVARLYEGAGNRAIVPVQGSYSGGVNASGGTHDGGGAIDLSVRGMSPAQIEDVVTLMRRVGFAAWHRWESQGPWVEHIHGVAMGCVDASPAAKVQMQNYLDGDDGLIGPAGDYHSRAYVGVTWESYRAAHPTGSGSSIPNLPTPAPPSTPSPSEEDDMSQADIDAIKKGVADAQQSANAGEAYSKQLMEEFRTWRDQNDKRITAIQAGVADAQGRALGAFVNARQALAEQRAFVAYERANDKQSFDMQTQILAELAKIPDPSTPA